jgi:hypothetical protein
MIDSPDWLASAATFNTPFYDAVREQLKRLQRFPDLAELNALAESQVPRAANVNGEPLRFVPPASRNLREGLAIADNHYELRVYRKACVETRPGNWHDCFNALSWLAWPRSKAALNALHVREQPVSDAAIPARRSAARDAATLFDEGGAVLACSDAELAGLLRDFRWRELFCTRRHEAMAHLRCYVFGHALLDKARAPYKSLTAHALIFPVPHDFLLLPAATQLARLDALLAAWITAPANLQSTDCFAPLPLLGLPGFCQANAEPVYYDDLSVFRPGRSRAEPVRVAAA